MTKRTSHTACSHSNTARARTACRNLRNSILSAARQAFIVDDVDYGSHVACVALTFKIEMHDAYTMIEDEG